MMGTVMPSALCLARLMGQANVTARPESALRGLPVPDREVLDAVLDWEGADPEAGVAFIDWVTGEVDVRGDELAEAMIAHAGRRRPLRVAEPSSVVSRVEEGPGRARSSSSMVAPNFYIRRRMV